MADPAYNYTPAPVVAPVAAAPAATTRPSMAGFAARVLLSLLGAAGLIVGAFMRWTHGIAGTNLKVNALWQARFPTTTNFVATVGFVAVVLGLLAIVGLAMRSGGLTRLAGALGIVAFVLFAIQMFRIPGDQSMQAGAWVMLFGSVLALVGGFMGARPVVATTTTTTPTLVR